MSLGSDGIPDPRRLPAEKVLTKKDMVNDLRLEKRGEKEFVNSCSQLNLFQVKFHFSQKFAFYSQKIQKSGRDFSVLGTFLTLFFI
jgi:hypothetical protein